MATQNQLGQLTIQWVDKRNGSRAGNQGTRPEAQKQAMNDLTAVEARLQTINAGYYTNARLQKMTVNDKLHALRQADNSAGIK